MFVVAFGFKFRMSPHVYKRAQQAAAFATARQVCTLANRLIPPLARLPTLRRPQLLPADRRAPLAAASTCAVDRRGGRRASNLNASRMQTGGSSASSRPRKIGVCRRKLSFVARARRRRHADGAQASGNAKFPRARRLWHSRAWRALAARMRRPSAAVGSQMCRDLRAVRADRPLSISAEELRPSFDSARRLFSGLLHSARLHPRCCCVRASSGGDG